MVKLTRMFPLLALIVGVVLSVLPAEGQAQIISGKGTGIDPGNPKDTAGVNVSGRHVGNIFPMGACAPSATVHAVVNTDPMAPFMGSDVSPFNMTPVLLPLVPAQSGPVANRCVYEIFETGTPRINLTLGATSGTSFYFTLLYRQGKYLGAGGAPTCPAGLPLPPRPVTVPLTTAFVVPGAAIMFSQNVVWLSLGRGNPQDCDYLKFPAP
jgi:hypothetical protein